MFIKASVIEEIDLFVEYRTDYSGRGMYGDKCFGIVGKISDLLSFIVSVVRYESRNDMDIYLTNISEEMINGCKEDSMGLDSVYYFPNIQIKENL